MADADRSTMLANFMAIAGADDATALQYLEMSDWKLESAVNTFMAGGGAAPAPAPAPVPAPAPARPVPPKTGDWKDQLAAQMGSYAPPAGGGGGDRSLDLARRLQAEEERKSGQKLVRSPDKIKKDRLIDSSQQMSFRHQRRKTDTQQWMFPPPEKIIFGGSFQDARQLCKQRQRWLLVNIQSVGEFASHQLNRDTWSDETLQSLIAPESGEFIFWQATDTDDEAQRYCQNYKLLPGAFPHIAIIDPRTGEMLQNWTGFVEPQELATDILSFCSSRSLADGARPDMPGGMQHMLAQQHGAQPPVPPSSAPGGSGGVSSSGSGSGRGAMEEDADLAKALALSMAGQDAEESGGPSSSSSSSSASNMDVEPSVVAAAAPPVAPAGAGAGAGADAAASGGGASAVEAYAAKYPLSESEPAPGDGTTRVQIRFPDKKSCVRRVRMDDKVGVLMTLVQQQQAEALQRPFQLSLSFPRKTLDTLLDQTVEEAGLKNQSVIMQWL